MFALLLAAAVLDVGQPAPALEIPKLLQARAGASADWTALRGKPVVLEFWATWCGPCVERIPEWNELAARFRARVQFLSVTYEDEQTVRGFLDKHPMAGWIGLDLDASTFANYGVDAVPRTVLVDGNGIVRAITKPQEVTAAAIDDLLHGRALSLADRTAPT